VLTLKSKSPGEPCAPLEELTLLGATKGPVVVADGAGREYVRAQAAKAIRFRVGGTPGLHRVSAGSGRAVRTLVFRVEAQTFVRDRKGEFEELLRILLYTMLRFGEHHVTQWDGRLYQFFVCWLRDHVHTLKGMKYFHAELKSAIDLYRESQRRDGMIWDNVHERSGKEPNAWDMRFAYGGFIRPFADGTGEFKRIPVENDVEYLFVEGLYYTWKATGDDGWMKRSLGAAMRALEYSISSPYRWSEKHRLLKRGFTIDTWDFQNDEDARISAGGDRTHLIFGDAMVVKPGHTRFGIMYGDNTGYIAACRYLAEMLERVGRAKDAAKYRTRADEMKARLDAVAWNGEFYRHHVPEDDNVRRDFGVDQERQVSLSNSYSLNRGLTHEQCVAIVRTYQRLRKELPAGSPGEWYLIYPPFERGYGRHNDKWQYMNGGVSPIVAGELAHGAFEHGFEGYAADILRRLLKIGRAHRNFLPCVLAGALEPEPHREFTPLDLAAQANADFSGQGASGVPGWTGEGENDLHEMPVGLQKLAGMPFRIADPATNGRRGCIGLSHRNGYASSVEIPVGGTAASIYVLHAVSNPPEGLAGTLVLEYVDGSRWTQHVVRGRHVSGWWMPEGRGHLAVAWRGKNAVCANVGLVAWGLNNPHPEKPLAKLVLTAAEGQGIWLVAGVTLSAQPVWFPPSSVSYGIPENWGAAAVVYALVEGLAGVKDEGVAFDRALLAPRWLAAGVTRAEACIAYPASNGYVAYRYRHEPGRKRIALTVTGSGTALRARVLLPVRAKGVKSVRVDGAAQPFLTLSVERSRYVEFEFEPGFPREVTVAYA